MQILEIPKGGKKMKKTLFIYVIMFVALLGSLKVTSARNVYSNTDNKIRETWISISGTAVDPKPDKFTLDYAKGTITVEMAGWKWYGENYRMMDGDRVTVYGRLGETLFQGNIIDATSVYDEKLGKYFFGRSRNEAMEYRDDEDPLFDYWSAGRPVGIGNVTVQGTVTSVSGRLFTIDTGMKKITVNTGSMPYDPLDKKGYQIISKGDYLSVTGDISKSFQEKGELIADHIVVLYKE
jgi:uncharacterized protein YdeI (BOF family)